MSWFAFGKRLSQVGFAVLALVSLGATAAAQEIIPQTEDPVRGPYEILSIDKPMVHHGFASDRVLYFVAETMTAPENPQEYNVKIFHSLTKHQIGTLPPPDRGWIRPFGVQLSDLHYRGLGGVTGHAVVLDSLVPAEAALGKPVMLIEYDYSFSLLHGFQATKVAEHALPVDDPTTPTIDGMYYPTSWSTIEDPDTGLNRTVVADCVLGALWVSDENMENWTLAFMNVMDDNFALKPWPSDVVIDHDYDPSTPSVTGMWTTVPGPDWDTQIVMPWGMPMTQMGEVMPGLHGVDYVEPTDMFVFVSPAPTSPIGMISRELLFDTTISPFMKPYEVLVDAIPGVTDWVGELWYNQYRKPDSRFVYFLRSQGASSWPDLYADGQLPPTWYRVDIYSGELEEMYQDPNLNVPSHHYPVPCPFALQDWFYSCAVPINVFQAFMPDTSKFVSDYTMVPERMPFTMMMFAEPPSHPWN